jgi:hypothetical protein
MMSIAVRCEVNYGWELFFGEILEKVIIELNDDDDECEKLASSSSIRQQLNSSIFTNHCCKI